MKFLKKLTIFALAAALLVSSAACNNGTGSGEIVIEDTSIVLAENGVTEYSAVIPAAATEAERYAAETLASYFLQATGATLPVKTDAGMSFDKNAKIISVGRTAILEGSGLTLSESELTCDGFRIERYDNAVVLCGVEDSGTIYAVQDFLKYQFGYEAYAGDEVYIGQTAEAKLKDFHYSEAPDFEGRDMDGLLLYNREAATMLRIRSWNNSTAAYAYGASRDWIGGHCESFRTIISPEVYNDPDLPDTYHPEWFANSARQICLTNTDLIAEFIKNTIALVEENPYGMYVNIAEEDMAGMCQCSACKNEINTYGMSGYIVRFCNQIVSAVEEWREENCPERELKYVTFAYSSGSIHPPVRTNAQGEYEAIDSSVIPHEKLYIRLTPIMYCYSHAFEDENCQINAAFRADIRGWQALTDHFMVYDYAANYNHYFMFFNDYDSLVPNLRMYKEIGVVNILRQNATGSSVRMFGDLYNYLVGKLMWNTELDMQELIDDFMEHYYKSGAQYMKECLSLIRTYLKEYDVQNNYGLHFQLYDSYQPALSTATVWPKRILEQALELVEKASATYDSIENANEREIMKNRVLKESFCLRYLVIKNYSSYYNINSSAYEEEIAQFRADMETLQAYSYAEGQDTVAWIDSLL